jgi:hypothetical protein
MSTINIEPVVKPQEPIIMNSISITVTEIELNVKANIRVIFYDNEFNSIKTEYLVLQQPDYSNWGTDDQFIINWTLQQLGLSPRQ